MALQTLNGFAGYKAYRVSSMDGRAVGKLTDSNHLMSIHSDAPADYDKKLITIFTQTELYSNDLLNMLNQSDPYYIKGNSDSWAWDQYIPYQYPKVVGVPATTSAMSHIGIDGQEFELILSTDEYGIGDIITAHRQYAPDISVVSEPVPAEGGFLYKLTLNSTTPDTDYLDTTWIEIGRDYMKINHSMGEFDTDFSGLGPMASKIKLFETLSSGYGVSHKITDWADARDLVSRDGKPLDIMVYEEMRRNAVGKLMPSGIFKWEALVDMQLRKEMLSLKVNRMIWSKGGTQRTRGSKGEIKRLPTGIYHKILNHGHTHTYPRGEFNFGIIRDILGDLFYRRVAMKDRRAKIYVNEAAIRAFQQANKEDLMNSGLTVIADNRFIEGSGRNMMVSYAFTSTTTTETGRVDLVHLTELDHPELNSEFGQNQMSAPLFIIFDVANPDGGLQKNVREVRRESRPSMTYGYVDGTVSHLGFAKSQGMQSANKDPWYEMWFKDRADVFIEDLSKCIIIQEEPLF